MRLFAAGLAMVMVASACDGSSEREPFTFTPYPYTVVPLLDASPIAMSADEHGEQFQADQVYADVSDVDEFLLVLERYGFEVAGDPIAMGEDGLTRIFVTVPLGSAPAAVERLRDESGVENVRVAYLAFIDD